jgi:formylglycine-generating enzyme required for sulfatase activity
VETSEQQRRPAVGSLAHTLAAAQLDFDAIDLADMLWLAQFTASPATALPDAEPAGETEPDRPDLDATSATTPPSTERDDRSPPPAEPDLNLYADAPDPPSAPAEEDSAEAAPPPPGTPFAVPAAPALRTRMDLARALRPLMRKVPSRTQFDLDEAATVTQIAETEVWLPVVRPWPERWLELDLVVESSKTTVIWEQAIAELNHLVEYQGAFRALRTWHLDGIDDQIRLFPRWRDGLQPQSAATASQRPHTPKELVDPSGQRLIWLVSDCTSALWRQGQLHPTLMAWSQAQSVAIVQLLPEPLWTRTALRDGHQVKLSALAPGLPNSRLEVEGLPSRLVQRGGKDLATVPIVTLEAPALKRWARVVAGAGDTRTPGRSFDLAFLRRQAARGRSTPPQGAQPPPTAQERVDLFRATASKTARQLANLMAATPVSLPVINLLREAFKADFAEEVRQSHVAEVLLSGLLRRCDTEADALCRYEFWGDDDTEPEQRVRDILLGDTAIAQTMKVLDVLSAAICRQLGSPTKSFQALLGDLAETAPEDVRAAALPFATVGLDVLRRLGGEYADLAERYGSIRTGQQVDTDIPVSDFLLEDDTYEVAEFINFPPLEPFEFIDAQFEEEASFPPPLQTAEFTVVTFEASSEPEVAESGSDEPAIEPFEFTIATLHRRSRQTQQSGGQGQEGTGWVTERRQHQAYRFIEILPGSVPLEMVLIPSGIFLMGSPEDESGRLEREGPQHQVTVPPFCMGRYPITQAQWRTVTALPEVERDLNPDPSSFKGDKRPVERVSWHDIASNSVPASPPVHERQYRLPSEAEWEYACRAGTSTPFHFGDMISPDVVNYNGSSYAGGPQGERRSKTTPVGHFGIANAFGLSDMHGNVFEWCQDHWHSSYKGAPTNSSAWVGNSSDQVCRGGSWFGSPRYCRSAYRSSNIADDYNNVIGFRVCCSALKFSP